MRRLVYLCDWLPPDFGAIGQYALISARGFASEGVDVTLFGLTSGPPREEREEHGAGSVRIIRLSAPAVDRGSLARRMLWTLRTNLKVIRAAWKDMRASDAILFTGSPPFLLHFLVPANKLLRRRLIYRIADFHPECLMAAMAHPPMLLRWFLALTIRLRRRVDLFHAISEDQIPLLTGYGIARERIEIHRDPSPVEFRGHERPLPLPAELEGYVPLLYSGNWGVAHDVDTFVEGYVQHHRQGSGRVALWLNAIGGGADEVEAKLRAANVPVARGAPVQLEALNRLLVTPAAHLITLREKFVGLVLPSKVYGCIESGRAILYVGSARSDVDLLCRQRMAEPGDYHRVAVGDAAGVAASLERIAVNARRRCVAGGGPSVLPTEEARA